MLNPVATTRPKPVRRAISAAISPVWASDEPCGAATTRPGRPARAAMWPRGVCGGNSTIWVAPRPAVGDLAVREDATQEALVPPRDDVAHARNPHEVHADASDVHAPI